MRTVGVLVLSTLCALAACGGGSSPTAAAAPASPDEDRDGFTVAGGDCNDHAPAINPNGAIVLDSCTWVTPDWDCPRGSDKFPEPAAQIRVHLTNNKCTPLAITSATVQVTVREAHGTTNFSGEVWPVASSRFSPGSIPMGNGGDVLVDGNSWCTNPGGGGGYNVQDATVVLQTPFGALTCTTANRHTTHFPFAGETTPLPAAADAGGGPARRLP
jgi:hypothetical protein